MAADQSVSANASTSMDCIGGALRPSEGAAGGSEAREEILAGTVGGLLGLAHDGDVLMAQRCQHLARPRPPRPEGGMLR